MELSQQVVSLEIARRLKELNVPQRSLFYWSRSGEHFCQTDKVEAGEASIVSEKPPYDFPFECLGSAFTVSELYSLYPPFWTLSWQLNEKGTGLFTATDETTGRSCHSSFEERNCIDGAAGVLIHLIEAGIVKNET